ncbi:MAG: hypothetical protein LDL50_04600, partial [Chloroflexi bacterium]|nr:hypothetical protein [Chloroflexota bacterium]
MCYTEFGKVLPGGGEAINKLARSRRSKFHMRSVPFSFRVWRPLRRVFCDKAANCNVQQKKSEYNND